MTGPGPASTAAARALAFCGRGADLLAAMAAARRLAAHDRWTRERLAAHQRERLLRLLRYARDRSAFYRDLYRGIDLADDLAVARLPVTSKRLLMDNLDAVLTDPRLNRRALEARLGEARRDECYLGEYRIVATAGTSGLRGIFVYDRRAWRTVLANTLRWQRFIGIGVSLGRRTRICSIGADNPMHVTSRIPMSGDIGLFRLMHLEATEPMSQQVARLNAFRPDVLLPYPSIAALLAREQIEGRLAIRPAVVATHSELLTPDMAAVIERAWGIRPFNHYGLTEEPHVGTDCAEHAGIHLFEDTSLVEVVDEAGAAVPDGRMGARYLLTNLYNRTQPLIRYEVTDMIGRAARPCPCGRPFALLQALGGRAEDMLRLRRADGTGEITLTPMIVSLAVESFPGIREYAADHDPAGIRLRLVVPEGADRRRIETELPLRLQADIARQGAVMPPLAIAFVDRLARSAERMGKLSVVGRRPAPAPALPATPEPGR